MRLQVKLPGPVHDHVRPFRTTRSGRAFAPWEEASSSSSSFSIVDAVAAAAHEQAATGDDIAIPALANRPQPTASPPQNRDKVRSKHQREHVRQAIKALTDPLCDSRPRQRPHARSTLVPIQAKFALRKIRIAKTGFIGLRDEGGELNPLKDFLAGGKHEDFKLVKAGNLLPRPILDTAGKVCGVFGGRSEDKDFMKSVHDPAVQAMEAALAQASIAQEKSVSRRGTHAQIRGGDSFGGGQRRPGAMLNNVVNTAIFLSLISTPAFQFFASFGTDLFATWAPKVFDLYVDYMSLFYAKYTHLSRPFQNSIWSACTFNLGPQTCTRPHRDFGNLAYGWCAITALGNFDYTRGGHLVLWECKLIIEFPPGCTILIPSAAIMHSNIRIRRGERRYSFTQYTAGGLFRWVERDFQSEEDYHAGLTAEEREEEAKLGLERAKAGVDLFSTLAELKEMAA